MEFRNVRNVGNVKNVGNVRNVANVRNAMRDRQTQSVIHFLNHKLEVIRMRMGILGMSGMLGISGMLEQT